MKYFYILSFVSLMALPTMAQTTPESQMEKLNRGVVALPSTSGSSRTFVSWRFLGTDDETATTFDVIRDGKVVKTDQYETCYLDNTKGGAYQVVTKVDGVAIDTTEAVTPWDKTY
ncbi:MAG: rhamnogalacturonan lyase, partial [Prevotella sp.]|nr:rhamnogalacturonan lyase [Prevotella sp.]